MMLLVAKTEEISLMNQQARCAGRVSIAWPSWRRPMHIGGAPDVGHLFVYALSLLFLVGAVADVTDELGQSPHRHLD